MSAQIVRHPGEFRWEVRLLVVIAATLTVFGVANLYDAASMREAGFLMMLKQLTIGVVGGIGLLILSRVDYRKLRPLAWPMLFATVFLLLLPVLPYSVSHLPGSRRPGSVITLPNSSYRCSYPP